MNSHELARVLLDNPDMPISTFANNHYQTDNRLGVGLLNTGHVIIGNMSKKLINHPNGYITKMITDDIPDEWRRWG